MKEEKHFNAIFAVKVSRHSIVLSSKTDVFYTVDTGFSEGFESKGKIH